VIRIEPGAGDEVRRTGPFVRDVFGLEGSAFHQFMNAGKESLALDLTMPAARDVMLSLVAHADAAIFKRPLPVSVEALFDANPQLALVEIDEISNELCAYAKSGLLALTGPPDEEPVVLGGHTALSAIGVYTAIATSACLLAVRSAGKGQRVEVSGARCLEGLTEQSALTYFATGKAPSRRGFRGAITAVSGAFPCADGYWMLSVPPTRDGWAHFLELCDDPVLAEDATLFEEEARQLRKDSILDRISEWSRTRTKAELVGAAQHLHIPASPVSTTKDLAADPQLLHRGFLREVDHPLLGRIVFPIGAIAAQRTSEALFASSIGEHTGAILRELGYTDAEMELLFASGAAG
jgi:crotonobetainyl-CoA:carnitine CoA-transferase CaiB-like acyl-CoA transferase